MRAHLNLGADEIARARRLREFAMPPISVDRADFADSVSLHPSAFIYADLPHHGIGEVLYAGALEYNHASPRAMRLRRAAPPKIQPRPQ